jgi:hypothetical protein
MPRAPLLSAALALLFAAPAAADPPLDRSWSVQRLERGILGRAELRLGSQPLRAPADGDPAPLPPLRRIGLFANGMRFRVLHQGGGLDLRGGAYLRLLHNLTLQGSYRLFDYDAVEGDSSSEKDYHGPLFGLRLNF